MDRRRKRIIAFLQLSSAFATTAAAALGRKEGRKEDTADGRCGGRDDRDPIGQKGRLSFVSPAVGVGPVQWPRDVRRRGIRPFRSWKLKEGRRRSGGDATVRLLFAEPSISDRSSVVHGALLSSPLLSSSSAPSKVFELM